MNYKSFVYDLSVKEKDELLHTCDKIPPKCPIIGEVEYYKWRFENFMQRHDGCLHEPPVYYFGPLKVIQEKKESTSLDRLLDKITPNTSDWDINPIDAAQGIKEILVPLKLKEELDNIQKKVNNYEKGGRKVKPIIYESYGYKYCYAFDKLLYPHLTEKGQEWERYALKSLQQYMEKGLVNKNWKARNNKDFNKKYRFHQGGMEEFYNNIELRNEQFKEFAFATHPDAYLDAGLRNLPVKDLILILLTPDIKEWTETNTWIQAWLVFKEVAPAKLIEYKNDAIDYINKVYEKGTQKYKEAMEFLEQLFR